MEKLLPYPTRRIIPLIGLLLFLGLLIACFSLPGCSGGGGGSDISERAASGSSTAQKLPPETLKALKENARSYNELREKLGGLPDHREMREYFLAHYAATQTLSAADIERFIVFPPVGPSYLYASIPFNLGGLPGDEPVLMAYHDNTSQSLPLPGMTATKAHFLLWSGWSVPVPTGAHVGDLVMHYQDGTLSTKELIQGANVAEWAYDRPEVQPDLMHAKIPPAYSWSTSLGSDYFYYGHIFYVTMSLEDKPLDYIEVRVLPDGYEPYTSMYGIGITSMTLEAEGGALSIEDAKVTPEEFTPDPKPNAENNKTEISAQIVAEAGLSVDSIEWQVTIKDKAEIVVKTFDTRTAASGAGPWDVLETWEGKNDVGDYVSYGEYTFVIKATANPGVNEIKAEATGMVKVSPIEPILYEIFFENSLDLADDDGKMVKPIYYREGTNSYEHNPIAVPLSRISAVSGQQRAIVHPGGTAKLGISLKYDGDLTQPITYELSVISPDGAPLIVANQGRLTFKKGGIETITPEFTAPTKVQTIAFLKVDRRRVEFKNGNWEPVEQWKRVVVHYKLEDHIWVTLDEPKPPLDVHKNEMTTGFLEIACYLADGATNANAARDMMVPNLRSWLVGKQFEYDPTVHHFGKLSDINAALTGKRYQFAYGEFMKPIKTGTGTFIGEYYDISAFYALSCAAIGVNMDLKRLEPLTLPRFITYSSTACGVKEYIYDFSGSYPIRTGEYAPPIPRSHDFDKYQFASFSNSVWDPTLQLSNVNDTINKPLSDYITALVQSPTPASAMLPKYVLLKDVDWKY